jgi:hypothetical protein
MLQPARRKYRKEQKGRNTGIATRGNSVAFGDFGLKCHRPWPPDGPPDRGRTSCDLPSRQARRPHLDPCVPRQADFPEAGRSAHG